MIGLQAREAFWSKVDVSGVCWEWTGARMASGYGQFATSRADGHKKFLAHRFAWLSLVGEIPEGLVIDHVCRNKACVNPDHLEPVSQRVNILRGAKGTHRTHCRRGHPFTAVQRRADGRMRQRCAECRKVTG